MVSPNLTFAISIPEDVGEQISLRQLVDNISQHLFVSAESLRDWITHQFRLCLALERELEVKDSLRSIKEIVSEYRGKLSDVLREFDEPPYVDVSDELNVEKLIKQVKSSFNSWLRATRALLEKLGEDQRDVLTNIKSALREFTPSQLEGIMEDKWAERAAEVLRYLVAPRGRYEFISGLNLFVSVANEAVDIPEEDLSKLSTAFEELEESLSRWGEEALSTLELATYFPEVEERVMSEVLAEMPSVTDQSLGVGWAEESDLSDAERSEGRDEGELSYQLTPEALEEAEAITSLGNAREALHLTLSALGMTIILRAVAASEEELSELKEEIKRFMRSLIRTSLLSELAFQVIIGSWLSVL